MKKLSLLLLFLATNQSIKTDQSFSQSNDGAHLPTSNENEVTCRSCGSCGCKSICKVKKASAFCALLTKELQVRGNTTLDNLLVTGNATFNGLVTFNDGVDGGDATFNNLTVNETFTTLGPVNMGTNDSDDTINIGTGGSNRVVNIGNTNTGSETFIFGNENINDGISLVAGGNVRVQPFNITLGPSPINPIGRVGRWIVTGVSAPAGGTGTIAITSSVINSLSAILIGSLSISGAEDALLVLKRTVISGNTITLTVQNIGTQNLTSNVNIVFWILS